MATRLIINGATRDITPAVHGLTSTNSRFEQTPAIQIPVPKNANPQ